MPKKSRWTCEQIKTKFHLISDQELKILLAEFWEILVPSTGQLRFQTIAVQPNPLNKRLSNSNKGTRR